LLALMAALPPMGEVEHLKFSSILNMSSSGYNL